MELQQPLLGKAAYTYTQEVQSPNLDSHWSVNVIISWLISLTRSTIRCPCHFKTMVLSKPSYNNNIPVFHVNEKEEVDKFTKSKPCPLYFAQSQVLFKF